MSLKEKALFGVIWSSVQTFGMQIIGLIVSMILARLLSPAEFGTLAMIYIFTGISSVLVSGGLGSSLIRTKEADHEDYSTVFVYNLIGSFFIYVVLFFAAPYISLFYKQPILTNVVRIYCLIFLVNALSTVQIIRLQKKLNFKIETIASVLSSIISGIVGVTLAYLEFGVMALVWMGIVGAIIKSLYIWFFSGWMPSILFNKKKFKTHFQFGFNLTLTGLLDVVFENFYNIYIGRFYSPTDLGFYNRADSLKQLPVGNILGVLSKVTYPLFSSVSNDNLRLKNVYKQVMILITFVMVPVMLTSLILAKPLIVVLFSEKWLPSVPYFQILCIVAIFYPLRVYNTNIFLVKGRSDLFFKLEVFKKICYVIIFLSVVRFGIYGLLWGQVVFNILSYIIESHFAGKFINYSFYEQLKDISPIFFGGVVVSCIVYTIYTYYSFSFNLILVLFIFTVLFFSIYFLYIKLFQWHVINYLLQIFNNRK